MPDSVAELTVSDDVLHVDGHPVSRELLAQYVKNGGILAGWNILPSVALMIEDQATPDDNSVMQDICLLAASGRLVDLRLAAVVYRAASGERHGPTLMADFGSSASDCMWLVAKVGAERLSRMLRGSLALLLSKPVGLPVDLDELKRAEHELVMTGNMLADLLQGDCKEVFRMANGVPDVDDFGLPLLNEGVAMDMARACVLKECLVVPAEGMSLSKMAGTYPGVEFLQRLVRYRRLRRDLARMVRVTRSGRIVCDAVEVDAMMLSSFRGPSLEEAAIRRLVRSDKRLWRVDFSDLLLVVAREYVRKRSGFSKFMFHDCETLSDLGRIANGYRDANVATLRKYGMATLCGVVLNESAMTEAVRAFGFRRGVKMLDRVERFRSNVVRHYGEEACVDVWARDMAASLDANLSEGWRESIRCPLRAKPEHVVFSVLAYGNDPLSPWDHSVLDSVWEMLSEHSNDITIVDMVKARKRDGRLFHSLFNHSASTADGKVLLRCDRSSAGIWSVFTTVHEVMRDMAWRLLRNHGLLLNGLAAQEVVFESGGSIDADAVAAHAIAAMRECTGGMTAPVDITVSKRWR